MGTNKLMNKLSGDGFPMEAQIHEILQLIFGKISQQYQELSCFADKADNLGYNDLAAVLRSMAEKKKEQSGYCLTFLYPWLVQDEQEALPPEDIIRKILEVLKHHATGKEFSHQLATSSSAHAFETLKSFFTHLETTEQFHRQRLQKVLATLN